MDKKVYLKKWMIIGEKVRLIYKDGSNLIVKKEDFDRAFACMVSCTKGDIQRDFAIA